MNEASWDRLLAKVRDGLVVPVIGSRLLICAEGQHSLQAQIAERLLALYGLETGDQPLPPFRELNEAVTRLLLNQNGPDLQDIYADVHRAICEVTGSSDYPIPLPILQLSEITDFRLLVTLTPDDLLVRSLRRHRAVTEIIHAPRLPTSEGKDLPNDWDPKKGETHLLYLFGKSRPDPTFAIHDEDVLEYAHNVMVHGSQVPKVFLGELQQRSLLLIGCNFPEWLSRFFLRAMRSERLSAQLRREWLIEQLSPNESLTCFLHSYSKDIEILSEIPPIDFVAEMHRRWIAKSGAGHPQTAIPMEEAVPQGTMFFISYSRNTDLPRAEALYQALLNIGVSESEVWFDRHSIEPGQDFRHRILDGIRNCRYFLPLLSAAASNREEAFVFDEWQEANMRKKGMNRDFILPVIVEPDYKPERYTAKPILDGDWVRLDFCHAPEGVPDDRMAEKLKRLLRDARRPAGECES